MPFPIPRPTCNRNLMDKNNPILKQLQDIIGTKLDINESPKTKALKEQEMFCEIITNWDKAWNRGMKAYEDHLIELGDYDATFYNIIETLFIMLYGEFKTDIISWWVYERHTLDGELAILVTEDDEEHQITTPLELFKLIKDL